MTLLLTGVDDLAQDVLGCVCAALNRIPIEVPGLAGCPCRDCVVPGTPAWDGCDGGCDMPADSYPGQLSVNVVQIYPAARVENTALRGQGGSFPQQERTIRDARQCAPPATTAVELNVTVLRCAPLPSDDGCPPSCEELAASARQLHTDMLAVQQGLLCCLASTGPSIHNGRRFVLGASRTVGPQGGCVGMVQALTVALDDSVCCP